MISENLDVSNLDVLGFANYGTPNGLDYSTIYTQRIINFIDDVCASASQCQDSTGVERPELYAKYINHTIAHEAGHLMQLTSSYNSRFGGYHYKSGTGVILDQSIKYTNKGGKVTWYIGTGYTSADRADVTLQ